MPFQILALSGGGFFGYYTACVIARLEEKAGRPFARHFDLMAGTSVGGVIALALARDVPARAVKEAFEENGTRIFSERPKADGVIEALGDIARAAMGPRFDHKALRETIVAMLGENTRLKDLRPPVLIPTVELGDARARLFASYRDSDAAHTAADVAMAGAAVPTFFPLAEMENRLFVDGGLFANTPDLLAMEEALFAFNTPPRSLRVLSIGTATARFMLPEDTPADAGSLEWIMGERLMRTTMAAQQSSTVALMRRRLGDRYLRIDSIQTRAQQDVLGLHVATKRAQRLLSEMADAAAADVAGDPRLTRFLCHRGKSAKPA